MTLYCHNCRAAIATGYQRRDEGNNYHKNCPTLREPRGEISTSAVVQIEKQRQAYIAALELVLLYHAPMSKNDEEAKARKDTWDEVTGSAPCSLKSLCDHIRKVLE